MQLILEGILLGGEYVWRGGVLPFSVAESVFHSFAGTTNPLSGSPIWIHSGFHSHPRRQNSSDVLCVCLGGERGGGREKVIRF